jgi:two-component system, NtrC family, sensor kinase
MGVAPEAFPIKAEKSSASGRSLLEGRVIHIPDVKADPEYTWVEAQRLGDFRTILAVPMLREGTPIGVSTLTRSDGWQAVLAGAKMAASRTT